MKTRVSTTPHLISSVRSLIASRSFRDITSAFRSSDTANEPRNSHGSIATNTASATSTIGAMLTRKSLNSRPARLPMMMLGGSPIKVAAPPMLEAKTSAIKKGTGLMSSRSHTRRVTGAISSTVVTLSRNAEASAVTSTSKIITRSGEPLARLAAQMARNSNTPVFRSTLTMIIMPSSRKITFQSAPVSGEKKASSAVQRAHGEQDAGAAEGGDHFWEALDRDQHVGSDEDRDRGQGHGGPISGAPGRARGAGRRR